MEQGIQNHVRDARATAATVGMALFIASEVMFFAGLIGAYLVIKSAQPTVFAQQAKMLSVTLGTINTLVMIGSTVTMSRTIAAARRHDRRGVFRFAGVTLLLSCVFLSIKGYEYADKFHHRTVAVKDPTGDRLLVYDGRVLSRSMDQIKLLGSRTVLTPGESFDIHTWPPTVSGGTTFTIDRTTVLQDLWDGPFKNNFFGCYFALTGAHVVHLLGGMIALLFVWMRSSRTLVPVRSIEPIGMYWQFVDAVWIVLYVSLYWIG